MNKNKPAMWGRSIWSQCAVWAMMVVMVNLSFAQSSGRYGGKGYSGKVNQRITRVPRRMAGGSSSTSYHTGQTLTFVQHGVTRTLTNVWGNFTLFNLQIRDNRDKPYGLGRARESFHNIIPPTYQPNDAGGPQTWPIGANVPDTIGFAQEGNPNYPTTIFMFAFDQRWYSDVEIVASTPNAGVSVTIPYTLNTHKIVHRWMTPTKRTIGR